MTQADSLFLLFRLQNNGCSDRTAVLRWFSCQWNERQGRQLGRSPSLHQPSLDQGGVLPSARLHIPQQPLVYEIIIEVDVYSLGYSSCFKNDISIFNFKCHSSYYSRFHKNKIPVSVPPKAMLHSLNPLLESWLQKTFSSTFETCMLRIYLRRYLVKIDQTEQELMLE